MQRRCKCGIPSYDFALQIQSFQQPRGSADLVLLSIYHYLSRKSIEPMAVALVGGNTRSEAMQQFISQGAWSDDEVLALGR